ncbi:MAG: DNA-directed RNA polymerase subunit omega [Sporomusaceae bacterium]|nr:DNA-directed RNA polymerase subunit omega [Sporomusaceae bacterium]
MIHPSLDMITDKVDSKYTLVVLTAKRAREIVAGSPATVESKSNKPVTLALEEIMQNHVSYERTKVGIK